MKEQEIIKIFEELGALKKGHFLLSSGLHSNTYFQAALVLQYPDKAEALCRQLTEMISGVEVDIVIGPALGGVVFSYQLAQLLNKPSIFAERQDGKLALRRGFTLEKGQRVLIAEDVVTTGGSVDELIELVKSHGAEVAAVLALVDRSASQLKFKDIKYNALIRLDVNTYKPVDCPLCQKGVPLEKPGSRKQEK